MSPRTFTPTTKRAPQRPLVSFAIAATLVAVAVIAYRRQFVIPAAWAALGLVWLAIRFGTFETARRAIVPVTRWRSEADLASPSLDVAPSDNLAWPILALPTHDGTQTETPAPFAYYLHEFVSKDVPDADLPATLPIRYHATPLGPIVMADDRAHVLTGPALFIAAMLLLWSLWAPVAHIGATMTN